MLQPDKCISSCDARLERKRLRVFELSNHTALGIDPVYCVKYMIYSALYTRPQRGERGEGERN